MPKTEHSTFATTLDPTQIKSVLSSVLSDATVEPLNQGPLDGEAAIAILASQRGGMFKRSPFGPGNAIAQIIVEDHGNTSSVELIAMGHTLTDGMRSQLAANNAMEGLLATRENPNMKSGRNMVAAIRDALRVADPGLRQTS